MRNQKLLPVTPCIHSIGIHPLCFLFHSTFIRKYIFLQVCLPFWFICPSLHFITQLLTRNLSLVRSELQTQGKDKNVTKALHPRLQNKLWQGSTFVMGLMGGASAVIDLIVDYIIGSVKTWNKDWQKERMAINLTHLREMWTNFLYWTCRLKFKFYVRQKLSQLWVDLR